MSSATFATDVALERSFWRRYARTSHQLNLAIVVLDTLYVLATWHGGAHRPLLLALNVVGIAGLVAALVFVPEEQMAASPHRDLIFGIWSGWGTALVCVAVWGDGGVKSPLAWLLPLSVMFTAVVHRPVLVRASGALAAVG
ncbi:MAG: hypothetical protein JWN48_5937, partial [Myxococcaceae bacterium]|nr:hypothetical protein [Myxococcaceae bacterium]